MHRDNPLRFIDKDGMLGILPPTDYYNLNGKNVKHVDDDKDDKMLVLTTSSKEKNVDEAIDNGNTMNAPSNDVVNTMEGAYDESEKSGKEYDFEVGQKGGDSKTV
ncbi:MAG TPA: hypothetical protein VL053_01540 [Arachidicoccus sp.]|nr:hypothetical protein [Arachidicoccus sp.]